MNEMNEIHNLNSPERARRKIMESKVRSKVRVVLLISLTLLGIKANATPTSSAWNPCRIWHGEGTKPFFWGSPQKRVLEMGRLGHVALSEHCGKPTVTSEGTFPKNFNYHVVLVRDSAPSGNEVFVYQIHFVWKGRMPDIRQIPLTIKTEKRGFPLVVEVVADGLEASIRSSEAKRDVSGAHKEAEEAKRRAEEASDKASQAQKTAESIEANNKAVSIDFSGFRSVETAGKPGWGTSLTVSGVFHRFGGMWGLAAAGRLSWHVYELELIGAHLVNDDVSGSEFDLVGLFQLHLQPTWWFRAHLETGFGVRMFSHPDAVTVQDANLYIRGTEGRIDAYPLWACGAGLRFSPHRRLAFHLFYQMDLTLTRQVQHPSGDPMWDPQHAHIFNHKLGFGLSVEF